MVVRSRDPADRTYSCFCNSSTLSSLAGLGWTVKVMCYRACERDIFKSIVGPYFIPLVAPESSKNGEYIKLPPIKVSLQSKKFRDLFE